MKTFWKFFNYLLCITTKTFSRFDYYLEHIKFYEDIQRAKMNEDHRVYCQYLLIFVVLFAKGFHFIFLYLFVLSKIDSIRHYAPLIWFDIDKNRYPPLMAIYSNVIILYYLMFFASDSACCIVSRKLIFEQTESVCYYYPYHYRQKQCGTFLKKLLQMMMIFAKLSSIGIR